MVNEAARAHATLLLDTSARLGKRIGAFHEDLLRELVPLAESGANLRPLVATLVDSIRESADTFEDICREHGLL